MEILKAGNIDKVNKIKKTEMVKMSNSGVIQFKNNSGEYGVYLHWNGGRDSIEAFLKYCKLKGYMSNDISRFIQTVANYFGGNNSIYLENINKISSANGIYIVDNWEIIGRKNFNYSEQKEHNLEEMLLDIDKAQPEKLQLGEKFLNSEMVLTSSLKIGDKVFKYNSLACVYEEFTVIGMGLDEFRNGTNVFNIPYVNKYSGCKNSYKDNINNYILDKEIRKIK